MRFEAKHNFFKRSVKDFKNITKALVKQHQRQLVYYWENFDFQIFDFGPVKKEVIDRLEKGEVLCSVFNIQTYYELSTVN